MQTEDFCNKKHRSIFMGRQYTLHTYKADMSVIIVGVSDHTHVL